MLERAVLARIRPVLRQPGGPPVSDAGEPGREEAPCTPWWPAGHRTPEEPGARLLGASPLQGCQCLGRALPLADQHSRQKARSQETIGSPDSRLACNT